MSFWLGFYKQAAGQKEVGFTAVICGDHMLMGKRRDNQKWTHPGGHLEDGEDGLTGAIRELEEESGIVADPKKMKHLVTKVVKDGKIKVYAYRYDVGERPSSTMKQDPDGEVYRWNWVPFKNGLKKEIEENLHVPFNENVILQSLKVPSSLEKAAADQLPGGRADDREDSEFNASQLLRGVKHEMEHTKDKSLAKEIAKDHLAEDPKYYAHLEKMEKSSKAKKKDTKETYAQWRERIGW